MKNRELDKWLAENIMGWTEINEAKMPFGNKALVGKIPNHPSAGVEYRVPCYTTSISDAFQVVEKMMEKFPDWFFDLYVYGNNYKGKERAVATFQESAEGYIIYSCVGAETKALAISLAAKEAIESE